jgi:hypothetical protein
MSDLVDGPWSIGDLHPTSPTSSRSQVRRTGAHQSPGYDDNDRARALRHMLEIYPDRINPGSRWGAANITRKQA